MKKHLSLLFVVSFLSVQLFSLWHLGEHAYEKHQHNGQTCSVYLHQKFADNLAVPSPQTPVLAVAHDNPPAHRIFSAHPRSVPRYFQSRAPPAA